MSRYIVQHRRGSASQWAEKNTIIPKEGEIVIEIDEENFLHKLKIGDGVHTYADLAYLMAGDEIVTQVLAAAKPRVVTVNLTGTWIEDGDGKYSQTLTLDGITKNSRLDLQPDANMIAEFKQLGLVFVTENRENEIIVYSVGNMPTEDYTMQATIVETECDDDKPVVGIPVGTPVAQSDWNQADETKADYIKNKPEGIMIYKGNMGYTEPYNKQKGDVYYCNENVSGNLNANNLKLGACDHIGESFVVMPMSDDENTYNFFSNAVGGNVMLYREENGNVLGSLEGTVTSVEENRIEFSGVSQAELEVVFSYSNAVGWGIANGILIKPLLQGAIVMYTGSEWVSLNGK